MEAGQVEQARRAAELAYQAATELSDVGPRTRALSAVVTALVRTGQVEQACQAAEQARYDAGDVLKARLQAELLSQVVDALVEAGHLKQAREVAADIPYPWWRAQALIQTTAALASAGSSERLTAAIELLQDTLRTESTQVQRAVFMESYLANLALFPDAFTPLTERILSSLPR
jgi:hypothetical protein